MSTLIDTKEYLAHFRSVLRFYIDEQTWFTSPEMDVSGSKNAMEIMTSEKGYLWGVSFKDGNDRSCVVAVNKVVWWTSTTVSEPYEPKMQVLDDEMD